ncbi:MAG: hypothetical protein AAFU78_11880 [Cyanobacteria bacterium J06633_2]
MPFEMLEIKPLPEMFGLRETGVFTTGFNWFTDYLLFPLITLSHKVRKGLFRRFWSKLFVFGLKNFSGKDEGVVFLLKAEGEKDGKHQKVEIFSEHDSAYDFTVIPVIACLKQYLDDSIGKPGLWMMGHIVDPDRLLTDMHEMNVKTQTQITN